MPLDSSETVFNPNTSSPAEQGQYAMLLHEQTSEELEGTIYFSLPDQENYLYEYEGDLEEALQDLPAIYAASPIHTDISNSVQPKSALTPEAVAVIQQIWNYCDQTREQSFEGSQDYNFQVQGNWFVISSKENTQSFFAISRDGHVESTFTSQQQENLMERFAIAHTQMTIEGQPKDNRSWER